MDTSRDWHPADIYAAIKKRGLSLSGLSTDNGYHPTAVGKALKQPWPKIERIIAAALRETPQTIWPSRYDPGGD
jgi:Ner family transcriptional regulator